MIIFLVGLAVVIADQVSKFLIVSSLGIGQSISVIPGFFEFTYVANYGAAWGLLAGKTMYLIGLAVVLLILLFLYRKYCLKSREQLIALALIFGGAIGNLIDRIRLGWVIDFFDFQVWPVFNIADMAIVAGSLLLIWFLHKESREHKDNSEEEEINEN